MNNTAPKITGIIAVAAMFGLLSIGVSHVVFEFEGASILLVGAGVSALVFVVLALGWREPQDVPNSSSE